MKNKFKHKDSCPNDCIGDCASVRNIHIGIIHKPTITVQKKIKLLKNQLARLMFKYYMSLDSFDHQYVNIMMEDNDIKN